VTEALRALKVRVVGDKEKPQFVAADIAELLGVQNIRQVLDGFDADEKGVCLAYTPGGKQQQATVYEPGLYRLLAVSRKPVAKVFQRWLFHEVLPCIRTHGCYPASAVAPAAPAVDPLDVLVEMAIRLREARDAQRATELRLESVERVASGAVRVAQAAIDQGENRHGYVTVLGYCRLTGRSITEKEAARVGRQASAILRIRGIPRGQQRAERWGTVGSYPESVLAEVFGDDTEEAIPLQPVC
jgi:prophage antirepressor-like protein